MTRRERAIVAALADGLVAPVAPLPPVAATDTVRAVEATLAAGPGVNRIALRAALHVLDRRAPRAAGQRGPLRALTPGRRVAALDAAARGRLLGTLLEPVRGIVHLAYYGDLAVLRTLGYDPDAVLDRARAARGEVVAP